MMFFQEEYQKKEKAYPPKIKDWINSGTSRLLEATGQQAYYRHVGGIVIVEELGGLPKRCMQRDVYSRLPVTPQPNRRANPLSMVSRT